MVVNINGKEIKRRIGDRVWEGLEWEEGREGEGEGADGRLNHLEVLSNQLPWEEREGMY